MKKTISAIALLATSNSMAMPAPHTGPKPVYVKVCLATHVSQKDGSIWGGCDESRNNVVEKRQLLENGCAEGQVALTFKDKSPIQACFPPGMVQL
ncbi:MAG: hypothetical protein A4S09_05325 [Proteobacteria bacterium SG_bin7]|nr:MAG: hypothetical protein A4S09_05325 [Proteobacteria bacterium SG_bin7]